MALGSTQPLTEMSTRNLPEAVKGGRLVGPTTLPPTVSRLFREKCGSPDVSQPYGLSWPVTGIACISNLCRRLETIRASERIQSFDLVVLISSSEKGKKVWQIAVMRMPTNFNFFIADL
jgi:hypothetical protein